MKKLQRNIFLTILTASVSIVLSTTATAQESFVAFNNPVEAKPVAAFEIVNDAPSNAPTVDERASKNFSKEFAGVTNAKWGKTSAGYVVRFYEDGIMSEAFLTKKGNCHTKVRYYTEEQLPVAVRRQIKTAYADFNITSVTEVHLNNQPTAFLVTITGLNTWKEIRVVEDEMDVRAEYVKN